MQSMSGMQWPHSRCASPSQAARCSGVPWAAAGVDASVKVHTTAHASRLGIRFRIPSCTGGGLIKFNEFWLFARAKPPTDEDGCERKGDSQPFRGAFPADIDFLNREISSFFELVTDHGQKLK